LMNIINRIYDYMWINFIVSLRSNVRKTLFEYLHGHSYKYFVDNISGKISDRIFSIVNSSEYLIGFFIQLIIPLFLSMLITIYLVSRISFHFGLIFLVWFLVDIIVAYIIGPKALKAAEIHSEQNASLTGAIVDSIINALNVKIFSSPKREMLHISKYDTSEAISRKNSMNKSTTIRMIVNLIDSLFFIVFFVMMIKLHGLGRVTLGDFIMIYGLYGNFGKAISWMGSHIAELFENIGQMNNHLNALLQDHLVKNYSNRELIVTNGGIRFRDLTVKYGDIVAIENFNLDIKPKEKIGIVGASGAGKSSLLNAILRFYDFEGVIEIDGQSIADVSQESLRSNISYITQEPLLFNRSIADNISYSQDLTTIEELERVAKLANIDEFINSLSNKYETIIGGDGIKLSGGQKQRISIARAILKDSPILLMDEATSALDSETEWAVKESMKNLMKGKTVLVIAHRLSTISNLDRLIVMEDGAIVEDGNHFDLVKKNGRYASLWKMQSDGFL
jgi:ATP-binding cassette subfamily B protein